MECCSSSFSWRRTLGEWFHLLKYENQSLTYVIRYAENHPEESNDFTNTCLAGLGTGLLASTAVSLSSTLADLPLAGADAVRLAFRMGIHVQGVSENLEARELSESPDTWAYVVHNV